jgi:ABC-2 type transport system ATP-binding protein
MSFWLPCGFFAPRLRSERLTNEQKNPKMGLDCLLLTIKKEPLMTISTLPLALEIQHVSKTYRDSSLWRRKAPKRALLDVSLSLPQGSILGLLGRNGAGKSTLIHMLAGIVTKTDGTIAILGHDIDRDPLAARQSIGIVPQDIMLDPFFSVYETLENQAGYYGVPLRRSEIMDLLDILGLADKAKQMPRQLSGGMQRRLTIAKAMVHRPRLLVLDEPTAGVDLELREQMWQTIRTLHALGCTLVITTHYLQEAQDLCDRIAIMAQGRCVAMDDTQHLLANQSQKRAMLHLSPSGNLSVPSDWASWGVTLSEPYRLAVPMLPGKGIELLWRILGEARAEGIVIEDMHMDEPCLDDVFLHYQTS